MSALPKTVSNVRIHYSPKKHWYYYLENLPCYGCSMCSSTSQTEAPFHQEPFRHLKWK